jgi:trans-aconitate 2-methyltransferase
MAWDVAEYEAFRDERARPFVDLVSHVANTQVRNVLDLGCGTGELTAGLTGRWPDARIVGVDSSSEMLAAAAARAQGDRLRFVAGDVRSYVPDEPPDVIVSNAVLHWVPDHGPLLARLVAMLAPGGTLAVQMPANFDAASHILIAEAAADGPWAGKLAGVTRNAAVHPLSFYAETLLAAGLSVDAWETVYLHVLPGDDAVLTWIKGTALRPVLARLEEAERPRFLDTVAAKLRAAYPRSAHGTLFPFRRIFFVARKEVR